MRLFKQKKHAASGYYFELQDLGCEMHVATGMPGLRAYRGDIINLSAASKWWRENAYILRAYRDLPER